MCARSSLDPGQYNLTSFTLPCCCDCLSSMFPSLTLASSSTFGLSFLSMLWVVVSLHGESSLNQCHPDPVSLNPLSTIPLHHFSAGVHNGWSDTFSELHHLFSDPISLAVMMWVGIGPGAMAAYLQASGQQSVPPAQVWTMGVGVDWIGLAPI